MSALREGLLAGRRVAVAGSPSQALRQELGRLGAELGDGDADALVVDHSGAEPALAEAFLAELWDPVQAVGAEGLVPAGRGGKVVLIGPRPGEEGAPHRPAAAAARAGIENLARTLSVEWARYGITVTALTPGPDTPDEAVATLVAYVLSAAGDYFSGCRFDLGATRTHPPGPDRARAR